MLDSLTKLLCDESFLGLSFSIRLTKCKFGHSLLILNSMRILFVTSEHPSHVFGGLGVFSREFTQELKKHCTVKVVFLNIGPQIPPEPDELVDVVLVTRFAFAAYSTEARSLENAASFRAQMEPLLAEFRPDIIHCNDRQTFLPFRFDRNVVYSSHLLYTDLQTLQLIDDVYFLEHKVEQCALRNSTAIIAYSRFAADRISKMIPEKVAPLVLPLGFNTESFYSMKDPKKIRIAFFGRFESVQKGFTEFLYAILLLGKDFIQKYDIEISLYGNGSIPPDIDMSLFTEVSFLEGEELFRAYAKTDIVVMPSKYEPFGLVGLEAMASGCLLLATPGLGMDEYAVDGETCVSIPGDVRGIAATLARVVRDFDTYGPIARAGTKAVAEWTWERSIRAHLFVYRQIVQNRKNYLRAAYSSSLWKVLDTYYHSPEESRYTENAACLEFFRTSSERNTPVHPLVLICGDSPRNITFPAATILSVTHKDLDGLIPRLECLPFEDGSFDAVYVAGAWETVLDPKLALRELFRVASERVFIRYHTGDKLPWQTIFMEKIEDWIELQDKDNVSWHIILNENPEVVWEKLKE